MVKTTRGFFCYTLEKAIDQKVLKPIMIMSRHPGKCDLEREESFDIKIILCLQDNIQLKYFSADHMTGN
jgi:hypothetical protein